MKLALPLGLLGLIALIALLLIYILKPKYQDKKVSGTYVWKLSLRYQKRKVPISWLKSSLLLIVQILIIILIAFMMSQPYVVLASKTGEKIVVLSASASMMAERDGKTRFDRAKSEIYKLTDRTAADGDKVSVIIAGEEADFVVRRSDSASYIKQKLSETQCGYAGENFTDAMELAEGVLTENPNAEVYLYTDCDYDKPGKVRVVNVASGEWNAAVLDFSAKRVKGETVFTAEVASYGAAAEIPVKLTVDGKERLPGIAVCDENGSAKVVWNSLGISEYSSASVTLEIDDSFAYDNTFDIYKQSVQSYKVQLESENPGFLFSALHATGKCKVDLVSETSPAKTSGYDLYVYDGVCPSALPTDGAVWFVDPPDRIKSLTGITLNGTARGKFFFSASGSSETFKTIMNGISPSKFTATQYTKVLTHAGFENVMSCNNEPVLLAKSEGSTRIAVLALDIHMTSLPVELVDFPLLVNNICEFAMARTVSKTLFGAGDEVRLNARAGATAMTVKTSAGETTYDKFPVTINADVSGTYTVTQTLENGRSVTDEFFVRIPARESVFGRNGTNLVNPVVMTGIGTDTNVQNDTRDIFMWIAIALFVLVSLEWGLQYREQY